MDPKGVIDKILSDAQCEADKIKSDSEKEQAQQQAEHDEKLAEFNKQTEIIAKKTAEEKKSHLLAAARMDIAMELLTEKRAILDKVFTDAKLQIKNLPDEDYKNIMKTLMIQAVETGDEEVIIDKNETRIDHKFIKTINHELGSGYKGNLRLSDEKQDLGAGFILTRGKISNNVSLNVLLDQAKKDLEIKLSKDLFEN